MRTEQVLVAPDKFGFVWCSCKPHACEAKTKSHTAQYSRKVYLGLQVYSKNLQSTDQLTEGIEQSCLYPTSTEMVQTPPN